MIQKIVFLVILLEKHWSRQGYNSVNYVLSPKKKNWRYQRTCKGCLHFSSFLLDDKQGLTQIMRKRALIMFVKRYSVKFSAVPESTKANQDSWNVIEIKGQSALENVQKVFKKAGMPPTGCISATRKGEIISPAEKRK